jgi:hypothetical protein
MAIVTTTVISKAYSARFNNLAEISHPSIFHLPEFGRLLQAAIDRNSPLTQQEIEAVFGPLAWDW